MLGDLPDHRERRRTHCGAPELSEHTGSACQCGGHVFWPDDTSLLDTPQLDTNRLLTHKQVTDSYLLVLALAHGGRLASLDRHLSVAAIRGGNNALHLI